MEGAVVPPVPSLEHGQSVLERSTGLHAASSTSARVGQAGYRTMTSRLCRFLILTSAASHRAP